MFSKLKLIFKLFFLSITLFFNVMVIYVVLFLNAEKRFSLAESMQGTYFSDKLFEILSIQNPNDSYVYRERSVAYNKRGMFNEGFKLLNTAVKLNPKEHLGYRGWMKLYKLKDYDGAIHDFETLIKISPDIIKIMPGEDVYYLLAISYQGKNNLKKSKYYFEKYFNNRKQKEYIPQIAYVNYGILLICMKDYNHSYIMLDKSLKVNQYQYAESYYYKGIYYERVKKTDSALINYKKALIQYDKGYREKDVYNEVFNELYREDILERKAKLN